MPENDPLTTEIADLAKQIAEGPDDVADLAADAVTIYRRERMIAMGLAAVDSMIQDGPDDIDESDPRLVAVREKLRDRLRGLLTWAKETGRM